LDYFSDHCGYFILKSVKASATILIVIPVTLCATLLVLYFTGQTFNIMTLGAIAAALGLIIDDAIVLWSKSIEPMRSPEEPTTALLQKQFAISFQPW
jgi:multidrug efflux pump subunit AcrB